ncbi:MAG: right-handed parallel beta-helix repeat-containing protein [Candidatus Contendobacter sp.]|nr:right-handed parallel beta-helix repeat-containing protein [Candidatus Contendobacter sp.]
MSENFCGASGCGIYNDGNLTVVDSTLSGNSSNNRYDGGGGIYNYSGASIITNSILSSNKAKGQGGGIYIYNGTVTITNSTLSDNEADEYYNGGGGGIYNSSNLTITNSTLSGNKANGSDGGGIYNADSTSIATLTNSTLSSNSAYGNGGGIYNKGSTSTVTVTSSTLSGNLANGSGAGGGAGGGGILNEGKALIVINSTLSGNSAINGWGGGILNFSGALTVTNSTLSGNLASSQSGGGIYNEGGSVTVTDSTLTGNSALNNGGGIRAAGGTLGVNNSLVAGNKASGGASVSVNVPGGARYISEGYNLFGENGDPGLENVVAVQGADIVLAGIIGTAIYPLNNNGGRTKTHLPATGSPAIDTGSNALIPVGVASDQRGYKPRIFNIKVDIGAVEVGATPPNYPLAVNKIGGNGTVISDPVGINCDSGCPAMTTEFLEGTSVTLVATPVAGYTFTGWFGDCTGMTCTITMDAAKTVTAQFANIPTYILTATKTGTGTGTVTSDPAGIYCGATCGAGFMSGTSVTLTATPNSGSIFAGWSGACNGATCTVTVDAAKNAIATFNLIPVYTLTITKPGTGTGTVISNPAGINCGITCAAGFTSGQSVILTATPTSGSTFAGWSGACNGATCTVTMDAAKNAIATFNVIPVYTLTITKPGTGTGTVISNPAGINCGLTCAAGFISGQSITLTAIPGAGSLFVGWSGCVINPANPRQCSLTVTSNRTVIAQFIRPPVLTVSKTGNGAGLVVGPGINCGVDCTETYPNPITAVVLTATPAAGSAFIGWTGCTPLVANPRQCAVTMNQARIVYARFTTTAGKNALTVYKASPGLGTVTSAPAGINCGPSCTGQSANFTSGSAILLTATPAVGSTFVGWTGCTPLAANPRQCMVIMNTARIVTVRFNRPVLTVTKTGSGLVSSAPSGIACGLVCAAPFNLNATVTLTATPAPGFGFGSWRGCTPLANRQQCTVTMNQSKTATAVFE